MALILNDKSPGKKNQTEAADMIAGADGSILIRTGQTLDGVAQKLDILSFVVNDPAVISSLIANDTAGTEVVGGGLVKGFYNINGVTLDKGTFVSPGKYEFGTSWKKVGVTSGSVMAYYSMKPSNRA